MSITIGYIPGVWDLLHVGHVNILRRASELCDELVVGVPSDKVVFQDKNRLPVIPLKERILMLESLRYVSTAISYDTLDFLGNLFAICPDIIFVGDTWGSEQRHLDLEAWVTNNNKRLIRIPYTQGVSTTDIRGRL